MADGSPQQARPLRRWATYAWRWFLHGTPGPDIFSDEDAQAFAAHNDEQARAMFGPVVLWMTSFNVIFWPTDAWVLADTPHAAEALGRGRLILVCAAAVAYAIGRVSLRRIYLLATLSSVLVYWTLADTFGQIGGPSSAWFHFIYPFLLAPVAGWVQPVRRVGLMLLLGAAVLHGYFHGRPAWVDDPMAAVAVGHLGYILGLSVVVGSYLDLKRLDFFRLQRELQREKASLGDRVDQQTVALRRLAQHLNAAQDAEQQRIARDLHDELGQMVVATRYVLQATMTRYQTAPTAIGPNLGQLAALLNQYSDIVRNFLRDLHPRVLTNLGLLPALRWLAGRMLETSGLRCTLTLPETLPPMSEETSTAAYRCIQEALTNVSKHAQTDRASVVVQVQDDTLIAEICDEGVGFSPEQALRVSLGSGLIGQRERARAVGGDVTIRSAIGAGTAVRVQLPLRADLEPVQGSNVEDAP